MITQLKNGCFVLKLRCVGLLPTFFSAHFKEIDKIK